MAIYLKRGRGSGSGFWGSDEGEELGDLGE